MSMDNKIAYIGGFLTTTLMTMNVNNIVMTAILGLIGGFFGILGKQLYYWIKDIIWKK